MLLPQCVFPILWHVPPIFCSFDILSIINCSLPQCPSPRFQYKYWQSNDYQIILLTLMSRFAQSTDNFYSTISYARPGTTDGKFTRSRISSTGQGLLPNNTINNFRPQSGFMLRSSSSSFRNTKGKLDLLGEQLNALLDDVKATRTDCKETQLQMNFVKEELNQRGIDPLRLQLTQEIKALDKAIQIKKRSDMLKFQALHETCIALSRNSKEIKTSLNHINNRLQAVENLLGFHGVRDKLKF